jgi:hypothetical protein
MVDDFDDRDENAYLLVRHAMKDFSCKRFLEFETHLLQPA